MKRLLLFFFLVVGLLARTSIALDPPSRLGRAVASNDEFVLMAYEGVHYVNFGDQGGPFEERVMVFAWDGEGNLVFVPRESWWDVPLTIRG